MHFCESAREDPWNLETVGKLYGSKYVGVIAAGGIDYRKVASMQTFRTPYTMLHTVRVPPGDVHYLALE
jgi:hypothetical protein